MTNERAIWLIWSNEHGRWWRPAQAGYTSLIEQAGRYPRSVADMIIRDSNWGGNINEMAVLAPEAFDLIRAEMDPEADKVWPESIAPLIKAGDPRVKLGFRSEPPLRDVRVLAEVNFQAGALALALLAEGASKP
jgi:hypothetical protein